MKKLLSTFLTSTISQFFLLAKTKEVLEAEIRSSELGKRAAIFYKNLRITLTEIWAPDFMVNIPGITVMNSRNEVLDE